MKFDSFRIFRNGRSVPIQPPKRKSPVMSLSDTLTRLAQVDDDETATIIATALTSDLSIRMTLGQRAAFSKEDVLRVALHLSAYSASPRGTAAARAGQAAVAVSVASVDAALGNSEQELAP